MSINDRIAVEELRLANSRRAERRAAAAAAAGQARLREVFAGSFESDQPGLDSVEVARDVSGQSSELAGGVVAVGDDHAIHQALHDPDGRGEVRPVLVDRGLLVVVCHLVLLVLHGFAARHVAKALLVALSQLQRKAGPRRFGVKQTRPAGGDHAGGGDR